MPGPRPKYPVELTESQVKEFSELSRCYTAPFGEVQRARILLLAHQSPEMSNAAIAREVGCAVDTVRVWRKRWQSNQSLKDLPRPGARRTFSALQRTQVTALACSHPADHGQAFKRWNAEKLAAVAIEENIVNEISSATVRTWLGEEKIKPWRYHSWQKSTDPDFVAKAGPVLDLYENAQVDAQAGVLTVCADEKTSIQARQRVDETLPAMEKHPVRVADRYKRMGALHLFCALAVASGLTFTKTFARKCFAQFKEFLLGLFASALCQGIKVLNLILDNGSTHAPKQIGNWIASLELSFEVRIFWLPKYASWLDQVEIIFSKVQRDVLTPNDFPSTQALGRDLADYFEGINQNPKPVRWTYTKAKMLAKFAPT